MRLGIEWSGEQPLTILTKDSFGYALQAGADLGLKGPWSLNVDVKKVWFKTDADINALPIWAS